MSTIIVLGTKHSEGGACTSEELFKIIEEISPDVVFCEASQEKLPQILKRTDIITPEIEVIKKLINDKHIEIVPVDVNEDPFDKRLEDMFAFFKQKMKIYSNASTILLNETYSKGFSFLNSVEGDKIFRDKNSMEIYFLNKVKYQELTNFYSEWMKWNDMRENQWIKLIHNYTKMNKINKAVFLVGAGHRYRLIDKINDFKEFSCEWEFFHFQTN